MTPRKKRILLVDDEERLIQSIARRLTVLGFEPYTATSGMAAIDLVMQQPVDLAIVDLQMPDMDGLVTITKLKEIHPGLKTVLLTGHGNEKVRQATESLNTIYFEKDEMGDFWNFIKKLNTDGNVVVIRPTGSAGTVENKSVRPAPNTIEIHAPGRYPAEGHDYSSEGGKVMHKVRMIKTMRVLTSWGIGEAKNFVDEQYSLMGIVSGKHYMED